MPEQVESRHLRDKLKSFLKGKSPSPSLWPNKSLVHRVIDIDSESGRVVVNSL